ncbi:Hypothetical Protein MfeM64YM_0559 [Mycoplasmopsis fermentans M64]|uniref:ATP synthase F0 subunit 8 n=1 Tax=Mycoplasmopsis fermentans (strain M64) TaxID=943945 RepID=A0AB32XC02_MYCFM|nr:Hypothetical Protein MfeM64YM_0559 [Mycoplasmopsis fermentans M64]
MAFYSCLSPYNLIKSYFLFITLFATLFITLLKIWNKNLKTKLKIDSLLQK